MVHLREVLIKLRSAGLILNLPKCTFGCSSVDFLGHLVSSQGIRPLAPEVEALHSHPQPNTIKDLQQFLGLLNFYRRFLPYVAKVLAPLTEALKGFPAGPTRIQWSAAMLTDFNVAKNRLSTAAELSHPSPRLSWLWWPTPALPNPCGGHPTPAAPPRQPLGGVGFLLQEAGQRPVQLQRF